MNTPFHFGMIPLLESAFSLFEEFNRGKARTETVLQAMADGDLIICYGREVARDIEDRLLRMGKRRCRVIQYKVPGLPPGSPDEFHPDQIYMAIDRHMGGRRSGMTLHVDHTFVFKWVEAQLYDLNHRFAGLVGIVGEANAYQSVTQMERDPPVMKMGLSRRRESDMPKPNGDEDYEGKHRIPFNRVATEDDIEVREPRSSLGKQISDVESGKVIDR